MEHAPPRPECGRRTAIFAFLAVLLGGGAIGALLLVVRDTARACSSFCFGTGHVVAVAFAAGCAWLLWRTYAANWTAIGTDGVSVPRLRGRQLIRWREVERVHATDDDVALYLAGGGRLVLPLWTYRDRAAVTQYLDARLAAILAGHHERAV